MSIHFFSLAFIPFHFLVTSCFFQSFFSWKIRQIQETIYFFQAKLKLEKGMKKYSDQASIELGNAAHRSPKAWLNMSYFGWCLKSSSFWGVVFAYCRCLSFSFNSFANLSIHVFSVAFMSFPFMSFHFLVISFFISFHVILSGKFPQILKPYVLLAKPLIDHPGNSKSNKRTKEKWLVFFWLDFFELGLSPERKLMGKGLFYFLDVFKFWPCPQRKMMGKVFLYV